MSVKIVCDIFRLFLLFFLCMVGYKIVCENNLLQFVFFWKGIRISLIHFAPYFLLFLYLCLFFSLFIFVREQIAKLGACFFSTLPISQWLFNPQCWLLFGSRFFSFAFGWLDILSLRFTFSFLSLFYFDFFSTNIFLSSIWRTLKWPLMWLIGFTHSVPNLL